MHVYTLQQVRATFARIAELASEAIKARELAAGSRKQAGVKREAAQNVAAQAVAQGISAGMDGEMLRAMYRSAVPASARKGVNLTQALAVLVGVTKGTRSTGPHADAATLLEQWAEGLFTTIPSTAYNLIRAARSADYTKMLSTALAGLAARGWIAKDVQKAVKAFYADYESRQQQESERVTAIQSERARAVAEDTELEAPKPNRRARRKAQALAAITTEPETVTA